jgi:PAS domain S-box-containing protein
MPHPGSVKMTQQTSTILIADDEAGGRKTLEGLLRPLGYNLTFASNGVEALAQAVAAPPDLLLLDVMMPGMDGFEVCRRVRAEAQLTEVPIFMVTALDDRRSRVQGLEAGADDVIAKPFNRTELRARVQTITRLNRYRRLLAERAKFEHMIEHLPDGLLIVDAAGKIGLANTAILRMLGVEQRERVLGTSLWPLIAPEEHSTCASWLAQVFAAVSGVTRIETILVRMDGQPIPVSVTAGHWPWDDTVAVQLVVRDITERKRAERELQRAHLELAQAYETTLEGWSHALDLRDKETEGHTQRVTEMTLCLARAIGLSEAELVQVRRGALLHDIGKMGIPDSILLKPGPLSEEEWEVMRKHPSYAHDLLEPIGYLHEALAIPYCHHEKWDGTGYPRGLKGEQIPLAARLFAVVDVWDALRSDRPYRAGWPEEQVREHIRSLAGTHFDPEVVRVFLTLTTPMR